MTHCLLAAMFAANTAIRPGSQSIHHSTPHLSSSCATTLPTGMTYRQAFFHLSQSPSLSSKSIITSPLRSLTGCHRNSPPFNINTAANHQYQAPSSRHNYIITTSATSLRHRQLSMGHHQLQHRFI